VLGILHTLHFSTTGYWLDLSNTVSNNCELNLPTDLQLTCNVFRCKTKDLGHKLEKILNIEYIGTANVQRAEHTPLHYPPIAGY